LVKVIFQPGGDKIEKKVRYHFEGFINLGAKFRYNRRPFYGSRLLKDW
jgi:UDP-N-acetylglucosamine 1-carboxyvinyltransferase